MYEIDIPVICSMNTKGEIMPLYFKYEYNDYEIINSKLVTSMMHLRQYKCRVIKDDIKTDFYLLYHTENCIWTLRKEKVKFS